MIFSSASEEIWFSLETERGRVQESGAKIVDEDGKTVTIKADGKTVVKGDSGITVTVTGSYSTKVSTSDANELSTDTIDRSDFDSYYGTSTTFGKN